MGENIVETENLNVSICHGRNALHFDIQSNEELSIVIELLELMFKKAQTGKLTLPTLTDAQSQELNMITSTGTS